MKRKTKGLLRLLLFLSLLLALTAGFFLWDISRQKPLAVGDRILLSQGHPGDLATFGISLYNNGRRSIRLQNVQLLGDGWELSTAQLTSELRYSETSLASWAVKHEATLTPVAGFRIAARHSATLGITLKRASESSSDEDTLVINYRLWVFGRQLRIPLG